MSTMPAKKKWMASGALLALACLLASSCASDRVSIAVDVTGLSGPERQLVLDATLDGRMLSVAPPPFTEQLSHFQVRLNPEDTGVLVLQLTALGADGCEVAAGSTTVNIDGGRSYAATLALTPQLGCVLTVRKLGESSGQVSLSTGAVWNFGGVQTLGGACPLAAETTLSMQQAFPLNTQITLAAAVQNPELAYFSGWSKACHGTGSCTVTIAPGTTLVDAGFVAPYFCSADQFCWLQPRPQGTTLHALSGSGPAEVFAIGGGARMLKWNGTYWASAATPPLPVPGQLTALWLSAPGELWAVGEQGTVMQLSQGSWQCPTQISPADLFGVYASAPGDVWAAGAQGALMHFDGKIWTAVALPGGSRADLYAIAGRAANDLWAVGAGGTILHFDGTALSAIAPASSDNLYSVWPVGPQEAWAVGEHGAIVHVRGMSSALLSSMTMTPGKLRGIWGASANSLWAVGEQGTLLFISGTDARQVESGTNQDLTAIWGSGISDVWAVGGSGLLMHFDGAYWRPVSTNHDAQLYHAIWSAPSSGSGTTQPPTIFLAGDVGQVFRFSAPSSFLPVGGLAGATSMSYRAIGGSRLDDVWLIGDSGTAVHWDGTSGRPVPTGTLSDLFAVFASSATDVLAAGARGTVTHYDGTRFTSAMLPAAKGNALRAIWGSSGGPLFLAGDGGTLLSYDGLTATAIPIPIAGAGSLRGLWGSQAADVWAVGDGGTILHFDGTSFSPHPQSGQLTQASLWAIWGTAADSIWAVGARGTLLYYDGQSWSLKDSGCEQDLKGVSGQSGQIFLIGDHATILFRSMPGS